MDKPPRLATKDPSLHQLEVFDAVFRHGTVTSAAEAVRLTQPVVSRTIAALERKFGWRLFERSSAGMRPTRAGEAFADATRRILKTRREALLGFYDYLNGGEGTITIATVPSVACSLLPPVVRDLRDRAPDIKVQIYDSTHDEVVRDVVAGTADVGVSSVLGVDEALTMRSILPDPYYALLPADHVHTGAGMLSLQDLADQPFILPGRGSAIRQQLLEEFRRIRRTPSVVLQANHVAAVGGLVAAGLGISAVPDLVRSLIPGESTITVPLKGPMTRQLASFWRADSMTPVARRFLSVLHRKRT